MTTDFAPSSEDDIPAYTPDDIPRPSSDDLRSRIPGWGADLDPADRPSYPKLDLRPDLTGAHWRFPERQPDPGQRERSIEHRFLTPVFGTAQPLRGLSGRIRRLAYARYSEGRLAHWLLLIAGDRVDTFGSTLRSFASSRPDNLITETGIMAELKGHPIASRLGQNRTDWKHHPMDPVIVLAPWVLAGWAAVSLVRRVLR